MTRFAAKSMFFSDLLIERWALDVERFFMLLCHVVATRDADLFPTLKLRRCPRSLAATLATLPSISVIPFLGSWLPA